MIQDTHSGEEKGETRNTEAASDATEHKRACKAGVGPKTNVDEEFPTTTSAGAVTEENGHREASPRR